MEVIVYKSKKEMEIWESGRCTQRFPVGIGKDEVGQKEVEGDMRTPEGEYVVCVKNPKSKFFLSVGLNYPNNSDAERGLAAGSLTQEEFEAICNANREGKVPPWKTKMGGKSSSTASLRKKTGQKAAFAYSTRICSGFLIGQASAHGLSSNPNHHKTE